MDDIIEGAHEAARDCAYLSERLHLPKARLEALIPLSKQHWRGIAGDEFVVNLRQLYEKFEFTEQKLLILSEKLEQAANDLSAEN